MTLSVCECQTLLTALTLLSRTYNHKVFLINSSFSHPLCPIFEFHRFSGFFFFLFFWLNVTFYFISSWVLVFGFLPFYPQVWFSDMRINMLLNPKWTFFLACLDPELVRWFDTWTGLLMWRLNWCTGLAPGPGHWVGPWTGALVWSLQWCPALAIRWPFCYLNIQFFFLHFSLDSVLVVKVVKKTYFLSGVLIFYCSVWVADETFFWLSFFPPLQRLGCDNMLESSQQEDPCLQCGGNGQSCYRVKNTFITRNLPTGMMRTLLELNFHPSAREILACLVFFPICVCDGASVFISGYNQMFIIPAGATTISIRETVATRNYLGEPLQNIPMLYACSVILWPMFCL